MHVVIITVIISYTLKKDQEGSRRLYENTKGDHEPNKVEKHCIRWYGPPLTAAFSKWPPSQIDCPPLLYGEILLTHLCSISSNWH